MTNKFQMAHAPKPFHCKRCEHDWYPRSVGQIPKLCPKCKSPYWNADTAPKAGRKPKTDK